MNGEGVGVQADIDNALCVELGETGSDRWLVDFHAGRRSVLEQCYRELYPTVQRAVGRVLSGADQETVIHEVFYRLISREELRRSFRGGALKAWIATVAYHLALEFVRRQQREKGALEQARELGGDEATTVAEASEECEARILVERFRRECLPEKWQGVFEARFLRQLPQRDAARELGIHRTTLAYQEMRIRSLLRRFLLREGSTPS
ncbi:RNA polymerase sigma factor [Hyalangium rubrum]|uniref:Sigma-70 family RNA polymerase sigma factor n=1 Tax=Hyalangium rubrum TaxID=3103134 RepID=A0ABU5H9F8_9BACT|nr:sigma-70 family RNA polymerase sigma factor [Hyalangium sp. s54d21]MDY7229719.1 sigma-70 family RNA polymerase sigma factor [Hyalangium sp. s54d21]